MKCIHGVRDGMTPHGRIFQAPSGSWIQEYYARGGLAVKAITFCPECGLKLPSVRSAPWAGLSSMARGGP